MNVIDIKDIDFVNYKKPSMYIIMPYCSFKCDYECGRKVCQNSPLVYAQIHDINIDDIINQYDNNPVSEAIVFGGLEPFDSDDFQAFIANFRYAHSDPIVIYTGYTKEEIQEWESWIFNYENIVIKFGRFIPDQESHYDPILGVTLASLNQFAEEINFENYTKS